MRGEEELKGFLDLEFFGRRDVVLLGEFGAALGRCGLRGGRGSCAGFTFGRLSIVRGGIWGRDRKEIGIILAMELVGLLLSHDC